MSDMSAINKEDAAFIKKARTRVSDLRSAMRVAGELLSSDTSYERALLLIRPGIYMRYEVSISLQNDGRYEVKVRSATHGTTVKITTMTNLSEYGE